MLIESISLSHSEFIWGSALHAGESKETEVERSDPVANRAKTPLDSCSKCSRN
jgi:hypothetical protein